MGEQGQFSASSHFCSAIMRSSRGKLFVYLAVLGAMCFVVFLLSSMHSGMKQLEGTNEKCQQQRDSLSAQLQVVYEHKNRLEKSLQQEKTDHKHTKEESEKQMHEQENKLQQEKENQQILENQISQMKANYAELEESKKQAEATLKEQFQLDQERKDKEIEKLQAQINELLEEKEKLAQSNSALGWKIEQHLGELNLCRAQHQQTETKLANCNEELSKKQSRKDDENVKAEIKNVDENEIKADHVPKNEIHVKSEGQYNVSNQAINEKNKVLPRPLIKNARDDPLKNFNEQSEDEKNKQQENGNEIPNEKSDYFNRLKNNVPLPGLLKTKDENINFPSEPKVKKDNLAAEQLSPPEPVKGQDADTGNLPQMPPPDNLGHGIVEKGDNVNYGNGHQHQVEQPEFKENYIKKNENNLGNANHDHDVAQMHDMLEKSPADEGKNIPIPPHDYDVGDHKVNHLNRDKVLNGRAGFDKMYEDEDDDDQDGENEDDQGHGARGKMFHEQDFDDQDPNDPHGKEVEGVVVAPK